MRIFRTAIAGILSLLAATASAQQFPTVPDHTVIGRIGTGSGSGPSQAIPFATLLTNLASPLPVLNGGTGLSAASGTSLPLWSTGATGGPLAYRAIVGTDLPNPSTTTLGAVFSAPVSSNSVLSGIGNDGQPTFATTTGAGDVVRRTSPTIDTPTVTSPSVTGTLTVTGANVKVFAAGRLGATTPAFQVNSVAANQITGIVVTGQASGGGVTLSAGGEANVPLAIDASGASGINIGGTSTGPISLFRNTFVNHDSNPTIFLGSAGGTLAHLTTPGTSGMAFSTNSNVDQVNIVHTASANRQVTLTGSNGGNPTIATTAGSLAITPAVVGASSIDGTMAATTVKCNTTAGTAISTDCTAAQARTLTEQGATLLAVLTASSSANLSDTTHITSAFDDYLITFNNLVPATNSVGFNCLIHSGGVFPATTYVNGAGGATTFIDVTSAAATVVNTAGLGVNGTMWLRNVNSTSVNKFMDGRTYSATAGPSITAHNPVGYWGGGQGVVDGLQCQFTSGNIASGNIKIEGLRSAL
jgi:hypothetical protein